MKTSGPLDPPGHAHISDALALVAKLEPRLWELQALLRRRRRLGLADGDDLELLIDELNRLMDGHVR